MLMFRCPFYAVKNDGMFERFSITFFQSYNSRLPAVTHRSDVWEEPAPSPKVAAMRLPLFVSFLVPRNQLWQSFWEILAAWVSIWIYEEKARRLVVEDHIRTHTYAIRKHPGQVMDVGETVQIVRSSLWKRVAPLSFGVYKRSDMTTDSVDNHDSQWYI